MVQLTQQEIIGSRGYHIAETVIKSSKETFLHTHEFYEMLVVTEGSLLHMVNGKEQTLSTDTICLIMQKDVHQFKKLKCREAHFVNLAFSGDSYRMALELYARYGAVRDVSFFQSTRTARLPAGLCQALLARISYLSSDMTNFFHITKQDVLMGILLDGLSCLRNDVTDRPAAPQWLMDACDALREPDNYTQGIPRFVALSGKSQEHLTRSMKKYFGTTPSCYLNSIKLDAATLLLKTTSRTVLDILMECGFNNVSYFNQVFKEEFGITPTRYRRLNSAVVNPLWEE